jgi:uncharacterized protein YoxC
MEELTYIIIDETINLLNEKEKIRKQIEETLERLSTIKQDVEINKKQIIKLKQRKKKLLEIRQRKHFTIPANKFYIKFSTNKEELIIEL